MLDIKFGSILEFETKVAATHWSFGDKPDLTPEQKINLMTENAPLPPFEKIDQVFKEVFWTSLTKEEGRPCLPRLIFSPDNTKLKNAHWFSSPVSLKKKFLHKLVQVQGEGLLVWSFINDEAFVTGILPFTESLPQDFIISSAQEGSIECTWSSFRLLTYNKGEMHKLSTCALPSVSDLGRYLYETFSSIELHYLVRISNQIIKNGHGGSVWILGDGVKPKGIDIGYPLIKDGEKLMSKMPNHEKRRVWVDSVAYMTGLDGAVLVNYDLSIEGFGAFIHGNQSTRIHQLQVNGTEIEIDSNQIGGGRHRSAVQFCRSHSPAAAIVVSQDTRATLIVSNGLKITCAELSYIGIAY